MKQHIEHYAYDLYLIGMMTLTFLSYIGMIEDILLPIFIVIGLLVIILNRSVLYVIPLTFFMQMSFSDLRDNVRITTIYAIVLSILIVFDLIQNRTLTKKGALTLPLLGLSGLSILTGLNNAEFFTTFAGWAQITSVLVLYIYFVNTVKPTKTTKIQIAKLLMMLSVLVTLEMVYFIIESDLSIIEVISRRMIDLGWENINVVIYVNLVSLPMIGYIIHNVKFKFPYMVGALISIIGILMTLSRSSIGTVAVLIVIMILTLFILSKNKTQLILQASFILLIVTIGIYYLEQEAIISDYILALGDRELLRYDDRLELLRIAWQQFKEHPIIGSGGLYSSRVHLKETGAINYHNTFAQASTLGILGLITFVWLFVKKAQVLLQNKGPYAIFTAIMLLITAFINGFVQPMYFYSTYMIFMVLIFSVLEKNQSENSEL